MTKFSLLITFIEKKAKLDAREAAGGVRAAKRAKTEESNRQAELEQQYNRVAVAPFISLCQAYEVDVSERLRGGYRLPTKKELLELGNRCSELDLKKSLSVERLWLQTQQFLAHN